MSKSVTNAAALGKSPKRLKRVALIVESAIAPRRHMLTGVARYNQEHEPWSIYLKPHGVEKSMKVWLADWAGDGIIAAVHDPATEMLSDIGIPVVDIVGIMQSDTVPLVHTNDRSVGRLGAEHLLERGFRHFGFVEYDGWFFSAHRREGFVQRLQEAGLVPQIYRMPLPVSGSGGPETWEKQQTGLMEWIESLPKPVGVMTTHDLQGQQFLEACQRLGVNVPEAVAVIGADNDEPICRISSPPLSSVIINDHQRGYEAAALLSRMMNGEPPPKQPIYVEPVGVFARASTDVMAIDDEVLVSALRFLREEAYGQTSVDDVVREVRVSRSVLERKFRKTLGRSINSEMVRLRLNRAIELLTDTQLELKLVAYRCGFGTQAYMNTVFKAKLGRTPGSYRKQVRSSDESQPPMNEEGLPPTA